MKARRRPPSTSPPRLQGNGLLGGRSPLGAAEYRRAPLSTTEARPATAQARTPRPERRTGAMRPGHGPIGGSLP